MLQAAQQGNPQWGGQPQPPPQPQPQPPAQGGAQWGVAQPGANPQPWGNQPLNKVAEPGGQAPPPNPNPNLPTAIAPSPGGPVTATTLPQPKRHATLGDWLTGRKPAGNPPQPSMQASSKADFMAFSLKTIPVDLLRDIRLEARTSSGNHSEFRLNAFRDATNRLFCTIVCTTTRRIADGGPVFEREEPQLLGPGTTYDLDQGAMNGAATECDIWWDGERGLMPRNGAVLRIARDYTSLSTDPVPATHCRASIVKFVTNKGNKAVVEVRGSIRNLELWYLETTAPDGRRVTSREAQLVQEGGMYDLDVGTAATGDILADLRWSWRDGLTPLNGARCFVLFDFHDIASDALPQYGARDWHPSRVWPLANNTTYALLYCADAYRGGILTCRYTAGDTIIVTRIKNWAYTRPYRRRDTYDERIVMKPGDRLDLLELRLNPPNPANAEMTFLRPKPLGVEQSHCLLFSEGSKVKVYTLLR